MMEDEEITAALQELAASAVNPQSVMTRIHRSRARRKWAHQAVTVTGAGLAVGALFTGVTWLHEAQQGVSTLPDSVPPAVGSQYPSTRPTPTAHRTKSAPVYVTPPPAQMHAFEEAGYDSSDAERLAGLWKTGDPLLAEAIAGQTILDGRTLPIDPGGRASSIPEDYEGELMHRFLSNGFDYNDAQKLGRVWNAKDELVTKAVAGQMILDGRLAEVKAALAAAK